MFSRRSFLSVLRLTTFPSRFSTTHMSLKQALRLEWLVVAKSIGIR